MVTVIQLKKSRVTPHEFIKTVYAQSVYPDTSSELMNLNLENFYNFLILALSKIHITIL